MKTMKHLFYLAVSLILLVNTSSDVYAYGNDWFEDKNNFTAYYDGMGNIYFDLLVWTEGASYNHWASSFCGGTYIEYTTKTGEQNPTYNKLFYYNGDNVGNKEKDAGYVWIKPDTTLGLLTVLNDLSGLDKPVPMIKDTVTKFKLPHNGDERRSVSVSLKWSIPQTLEGQTINIRIHLVDERFIDCKLYDYTLMEKQPLEKGDIPELYEPVLYQGGSGKEAAGKIMVSYVFIDKPKFFTTSFNPKDTVEPTDPIGYITIPATDAKRSNFYIDATVERMNGQTAKVKSNSVDILPYHKIDTFSIAAYCNYQKGGNTGGKVLTWRITNPNDADIVPYDYFEIQRAYKADFSDAQTIDNTLYTKGIEWYQYIDSSASSINPKSDTVRYRIRRMSSSVWGWDHNYAKSASYVESIRQMGLDLYKDDNTPYVAFKDCSNDSINIIGQIIWQDSTQMRTVAWEKDVTLDICLKDEQGTITLKTLNLDSLRRWNEGTMVILGFAYQGQLPTLCQRYDLFVRLNAENTRFAKPKNTEVWFYPKRRISAINVLSVMATDSVEKHPAYTAIGWKADGQPDYFTILRSSDMGKFDTLTVVDGKQNQYLDYQCVPGKEYTYKVEAVTLCTGEPLVTDKEDKGSRSRYGSIEGYVSYTNADKVAGINVVLKDTRTNDSLQTRTSADGKYKFSHLKYALEGTTYSVMVTSTIQNFYPSAGGLVANVTLNASVPTASNINFESSSYQRYSGRVLYTGTSIPVRDAHFLISDSIAMSGGDTVRTDASGNFVLSVPAGPDFTLTVVKNKHTFVNDGRLFNGNSDTLNAQSGSLDAIRFWDNTRTHLIGRLVGGDIQGNKPLGFGLSKNNLGDTLKLVFELEGDNIAHFVFNEKDLTKNTRDTTYTSIINKDTMCTHVRFEEKRVIVRPDRKTGEYMIDLPPVKYRIVEASANGYATLFSAGRTSETKDLTNSLDMDSISYEGKQVKYHDTYSVIYHAPASVAVTQLRFGVPMEHYGEEVVEGYTLGARRMDVVCYQKDGKWIQKFGYPVYISGLQYSFRINAREEYRYNNDRNSAPDLVPLGKHEFTVYNGLKSGTSIIKNTLDTLGNADILLDVENMSFDGVEDQVLKHFDVSVNINGQDAHAEPIKAFVTGSRITGADAMQDIGTKVTVEDVLRDPPGTSSYAWLDKGATYTTSYNVANAFGFGLDFAVSTGKGVNQSVGAVAAPEGAGTYNGTFTENASGTARPIAGYSQGFSWNQNYTYTYTTSERIQTSGEANIMGADATLFIGHTVNAYAMNAETFNVVDSVTLKMMQPAIEQGVAHVVTIDSLTGSAMIVTQDLAFTLDKEPVRFIYTQDHIVKQIIPQLMAQMASVLRTGTDAEMRALADATGEYVYRYKELTTEQDTVPYEVFAPKGKPAYPLVDKIKGYNSLITQWYNALATNEYCELYGTMPQNRLVSYSISGNTSVSHTETGSAGYNYSVEITEKPSTDALNNLTGLIPGGGGDNQEIKAIADMINAIWGNNKKDGISKDSAGIVKLNTPIKQWQFNWKTSLNYNHGSTRGRNRSLNRTIGFTLAQAEYGYIDVDVYRLTGQVDFNNDPTVASWRDNAINTTTRKDFDTCHFECSDFIYLLRGGATRCQWIPERTTQFYRPGTLLDPATVKLDEAHMEVDQHEVSGVTADGVAVFDLQIWNESEAAPGIANGPHNFILKLLEGSNPNGAKVTIDGLALTGTGRNFFLSPGQIIHKKMEVRQGALSLNYDSLKLCLMSDCDTSNYVNQFVSVHFLPASSPVRIATPDDKWVMNTNSPYDKQGYYLPVVIDGFDPDYANFDHIELQYKLSTQSENNWVTLCSYFVDSVYYQKASGNKQMFSKEAGRIDNIHFYGERDPMEQRYDLRAVSYCRYGTGYVSKASEPVSGIKDTRRPELFGKVAPASGVLTQQDYISVPFSEPIAYNYLDEDNNFQVVGYKNKADYYSTPTLLFSGNGYAATKVSHNLTQSDFTIDLTVLQKNNAGWMTYFSTGEVLSGNEKGIEFGWTGKSLFARIGKITTFSDTVKMPNAFTRVSMTYNKANKRVEFYMGNVLLKSDSVEVSSDNCAAPLFFGVDKNGKNSFMGRMAEARIWSKALTMEEITATNNTCLTGYESGLLAYYPMTEGSGITAYDKAHGANAYLNSLTWNMPEGKALKVSGAEGVMLASKWFNNSADADYTLIFSFRSNTLNPFSGEALLFGNVDVKTDSTKRQVGIFMTQDGQIALVSGSKSMLVADGNYNDGDWHSLGLVVSRGFNYTHLYIDNKLKAQTDGQFFGIWAMPKTFLGQNFNGYFDELSMWELAMPPSYLSEFNTWAPNGQELGLRCYLPFDQRIKNASSIYETHYSQYSAKLYYNNEKREWNAKQDTVVLSKLDDQSTTDDVCPLIRNSEYEKMRFSWTARDNDLVINLKMPDAEINHKNIYFSLRDVEDLQGNRLLSPIAWSVYLDRNIIRWEEQNLWVEKNVGTMDTVVYATIANTSGEAKSFVISGLPEWVMVDEPIGLLQPQEKRVLAFTISGDLKAGDYVVPVYVTDEMDLTDQVLMNVRVNAAAPNWTMPKEYELNMNLIGTVHLRDESHGTYVDTDTRDVVGAFYGETCVGMQTITSVVGSTANLYLKIYGDANMNKKDISLRLWQASTGKTFVLMTDSSNQAIQSTQYIRFVPDTVYGSVKKPVLFYEADLRVQNIPVHEGWNWISFYVNPDKIKSSFITTGGFTQGDVIKSYSAQNNVSIYTPKGWSKNIPLDYHNTYMLYMKNSKVVEVRGTALSASKAPELTFRHGWNNLPCFFETNTPLATAMSDYFNAAMDGDVVTGYYQFAIFDNQQWVGSLETLIPGEGYMLYRQAANPVTVHFHSSASAPISAVSAPDRMASELHSVSTVMPVVAALESNETTTCPKDAILRAYAHDKLVGEAKAVNGIWFLLVHAADDSELTFTVTDDKGEEQPAANVLHYGAFTPTGTVRNPYLIRFGKSDLEKVIDNGILYIRRNGNIYDAQGALVK